MDISTFVNNEIRPRCELTAKAIQKKGWLANTTFGQHDELFVKITVSKTTDDPNKTQFISYISFDGENYTEEKPYIQCFFSPKAKHPVLPDARSPSFNIDADQIEPYLSDFYEDLTDKPLPNKKTGVRSTFDLCQKSIRVKRRSDPYTTASPWPAAYLSARVNG